MNSGNAAFECIRRSRVTALQINFASSPRCRPSEERGITTDRRLTRSPARVIPDRGHNNTEIKTDRLRAHTSSHIVRCICRAHDTGGLSFATNTFDENSVSPPFDSPFARTQWGNFSPSRKCFCLRFPFFLSLFFFPHSLSPLFFFLHFLPRFN